MRTPSAGVQRELDAAKALVSGGDPAGALVVYRRLWDRLVAEHDHFHATVVAHMAGVVEPDTDRKHDWNVAALREADAAQPRADVAGLYPSLLNNLAFSFAMRGDREAARRCLETARTHFRALEAGPYADQVKRTIEDRLAKLTAEV